MAVRLILRSLTKHSVAVWYPEDSQRQNTGYVERKVSKASTNEYSELLHKSLADRPYRTSIFAPSQFASTASFNQDTSAACTCFRAYSSSSPTPALSSTASSPSSTNANTLTRGEPPSALATRSSTLASNRQSLVGGRSGYAAEAVQQRVGRWVYKRSSKGRSKKTVATWLGLGLDTGVSGKRLGGFEAVDIASRCRVTLLKPTRRRFRTGGSVEAVFVGSAVSPWPS